MGSKKTTSTNANKHPYMRASTWVRNQFWQTPMYTASAKAYFNEWLERMCSTQTGINDITNTAK